MSEKITRAQAEAAIEKMRSSLCLELGDQCNCWSCMYAIDVLTYLAQQPSDDVVRKAHEALWLADELLTETVAAYCREGRLGDQHAKLVVGYVAAIRAALPPMPEEK